MMKRLLQDKTANIELRITNYECRSVLKLRHSTLLVRYSIFAVFFLLFLTIPVHTVFAGDLPTASTNFKNMVFIKGGCFQMGDIFRDVPSSEKPVHEVCLDDFYLNKYEVTVGEFRTFVSETGYRTEAEGQDGCHSWTGNGTLRKISDHNWSNTGFPQTEKDPVVCVSWNDTYAYIQWLNKKEGGSYRLPSEAEWEYAARSRGKKHLYSWGDAAPSGNVADESAKKELPNLGVWDDYHDGYAFTAPVGSFLPNESGIYDMSGNAYEWIFDWQEDKYYANSPRFNPMGPADGKYKLLRGGAWDLLPDTARTTSRYWNMAGGRAVCIGFRLAHPANRLH